MSLGMWIRNPVLGHSEGNFNEKGVYENSPQEFRDVKKETNICWMPARLLVFWPSCYTLISEMTCGKKPIL